MKRLDDIITYLEIATEVAASVAIPGAPAVAALAPLALKLEQVVAAAIAAHAASKGMTVDQVIAQLHHIQTV